MTVATVDRFWLLELAGDMHALDVDVTDHTGQCPVCRDRVPIVRVTAPTLYATGRRTVTLKPYAHARACYRRIQQQTENAPPVDLWAR